MYNTKAYSATSENITAGADDDAAARANRTRRAD